MGSTKPVNLVYRMNGVVLETVTCARYFGIDISSNVFLGALAHTDLQTLLTKLWALSKRNIKTKMYEAREATYTTLVRSMLKYASTVRANNHKDKIKQIEKVQRRASRRKRA